MVVNMRCGVLEKICLSSMMTTLVMPMVYGICFKWWKVKLKLAFKNSMVDLDLLKPGCLQLRKLRQISGVQVRLPRHLVVVWVREWGNAVALHTSALIFGFVHLWGRRWEANVSQTSVLVCIWHQHHSQFHLLYNHSIILLSLTSPYLCDSLHFFIYLLQFMIRQIHSNLSVENQFNSDER